MYNLFLQNGQVLNVNKSGFEFNNENKFLKIRNLKRGHEGAYACIASNPISTLQRKFKITIEWKRQDGGWSEWSEFTYCSRSCGQGYRVKRRNCDNPKPRNGGKKCAGRDELYEYCEIRRC